MGANGKSLPQKQATPADHLVGQRIMTLRKAKGLSQSALGRAIGVSFQQLQKYEKATNRIGAGRLGEIARLLEVPVSTFFEGGVGGKDHADDRQNDTFGFLEVSGAMELLRLYASIEDDELRGRIVAMVRNAARLKA